jgi:hypothetical protein
MIQFNRDLLGKWLWCCPMDREALWRLVVETRYDNLRGGWRSREVAGCFRVGAWKYIRGEWVFGAGSFSRMYPPP